MQAAPTHYSLTLSTILSHFLRQLVQQPCSSYLGSIAHKVMLCIIWACSIYIVVAAAVEYYVIAAGSLQGPIDYTLCMWEKNKGMWSRSFAAAKVATPQLVWLNRIMHVSRQHIMTTTSIFEWEREKKNSTPNHLFKLWLAIICAWQDFVL